MKTAFVKLFVVLSWLVCVPEIFSQPLSKDKILFSNLGNLTGFTGGNQLGKVRAATNELGRANLQCEMVRSEPDTPRAVVTPKPISLNFPMEACLGRFPVSGAR